jgi:hypothetical protein
VDRTRSPFNRRGRLLFGAVVALATLGLGLAVAGLIALVAHPVTGPEIRDYIRDRYLRPWMKIPDRPRPSP